MKNRLSALLPILCAVGLTWAIGGAEGKRTHWVTVASISLRPYKWDKPKNFARLRERIEKAAERGAELVVVPEGALEGYVIDDVVQGGAEVEARFLAIAEPVPDGEYLLRFCALARKLRIHLAVGFAERAGRSVRNAVALISPAGEIVGVYRKMRSIHEKWKPDFHPMGTEASALPTPFGRVGVMICYDRHFSPIVDVLRAKAAGIVLNPSFGGTGFANTQEAIANARRARAALVFTHPEESTFIGADGTIFKHGKAEEISLVRLPVSEAGAHPDQTDITRLKSIAEETSKGIFPEILIEAKKLLAGAGKRPLRTSTEREGEMGADLPPANRPQLLPTSPAGRERTAAEIRTALRRALGRMPVTAGPPNAEVLGTLAESDTYQIEKVVIETRPGLPLTGTLYLPRAHDTPVPGVVLQHGHWDPGKNSDTVRRPAAMLAQRGYAAFVFDSLGYGERAALLGGSRAVCDYVPEEPLAARTTMQAIHVWEHSRILDYLESRPEIDRDRLAFLSASDGESEKIALYTAALDGRIKALVLRATPHAWRWEQGGKACEHCWLPKANSLGDPISLLPAVFPRAVFVMGEASAAPAGLLQLPTTARPATGESMQGALAWLDRELSLARPQREASNPVLPKYNYRVRETRFNCFPDAEIPSRYSFRIRSASDWETLVGRSNHRHVDEQFDAVATALRMARVQVERLSRDSEAPLTRIVAELDRQLQAEDPTAQELENASYNAEVAVPRARQYVRLSLQARLLEQEDTARRLALLEKKVGTAETRKLAARLDSTLREAKAELTRFAVVLPVALRDSERLARSLGDALTQRVALLPGAALIVLPKGAPVLSNAAKLIWRELSELDIPALPVAAVNGEEKAFVIRLRVDTGLPPDGFLLSLDSNRITISGGSGAGALWGAAALVDQAGQGGLGNIRTEKSEPSFKLRGLMFWLPVGPLGDLGEVSFYTYRQWLFDAAHWRRLFALLARERFNFIQFWHSEPLPFLLRMYRHPETREMPPEQLGENMGAFEWILALAREHGVQTSFMHGSHVVSPGFKRAYPALFPPEFKGAEFRGRAVNSPQRVNYLRDGFVEFWETYPDLDAIGGTGSGQRNSDDAMRFHRSTLLAAAEEFRRRTGEARTIVIRSVPGDQLGSGSAARRGGLDLYPGPKWMDNKFSHEHLDVTAYPDLSVKTAVAHSGMPIYGYFHHMSNVWPYSFGNPQYIQDALVGLAEVGAKGVVLHPLNVEGWPFTWDTQPGHPEEQLAKDWIWYRGFGRYMWNPSRNSERSYWMGLLSRRYGSAKAAERIFDSMSAASLLMPAVSAQFWFEGYNHWRPQLGGYNGEWIRLDLYTGEPAENEQGRKKRVLLDCPPRRSPLAFDDGPLAANLREYAAARLRGRTLQALFTPEQIAAMLREHSRKALAAITAAAAAVRTGRKYFACLDLEIQALHHQGLFWAERIEAGLALAYYKLTRRESYLAEADLHVKRALEEYRKLAALNESHYKEQPELSGFGRRPTWKALLPQAEHEAMGFADKHRVGQKGGDER